MLQTIHLGHSVVDDPQQLIYTPLDPEPPIPMERPSAKVICISSDSESDPEKKDPGDLSGNEISMEEETEEEEPEEEEEEAGVPPSLEVEYVPYSPNSAPRQSLVHPTQRNRIYNSRKRVGGGIL
ncbi:hypothetical protein PIB30_090804, partial [Stylosanthes scabra]|nr:hypothetical protein [Stylosanthes scabra]